MNRLMMTRYSLKMNHTMIHYNLFEHLILIIYSFFFTKHLFLYILKKYVLEKAAETHGNTEYVWTILIRVVKGVEITQNEEVLRCLLCYNHYIISVNLLLHLSREFSTFH